MRRTSQWLAVNGLPIGVAAGGTLVFIVLLAHLPGALVAAISNLVGRGNVGIAVVSAVTCLLGLVFFFVGYTIGWWLAIRLTSWEVAERSLRGDGGKFAPLHKVIVRMFRPKAYVGT